MARRGGRAPARRLVRCGQQRGGCCCSGPPSARGGRASASRGFCCRRRAHLAACSPRHLASPPHLATSRHISPHLATSPYLPHSGGARHRFEALERFDAWLSLQRFDHKLVLRGNHDPFNVAFPRSNATLITQPTLATIGGWTLSLVPFSRGGRLVVPPGDLIASHVPPKRILDRTYSGDRAGSSALRGAVERWTAPPPWVWLCGRAARRRSCLHSPFGLSRRRHGVVLGTSTRGAAASACALAGGDCMHRGRRS